MTWQGLTYEACEPYKKDFCLPATYLSPYGPMAMADTTKLHIQTRTRHDWRTQPFQAHLADALPTAEEGRNARQRKLSIHPA